MASEDEMSIPDGLWDLDENILCNDADFVESIVASTTEASTDDDDRSTIGETTIVGEYSVASTASTTTTRRTSDSSSPKTVARTSPETLEETCLLLSSISPDTPLSREAVGNLQNATHDDLDKVLANRMNRLSMEETHKQIQQIHGIHLSEIMDKEERQETPQFLHDSLLQLDKCLKDMPSTKEKQPYERAMYISPEYCTNRDLRLFFLRGERFDVESAARCILNHFNLKLKLFGVDLVGRDIRMSDLDAATLKSLESGTDQILPVRDHADRLVCCLLAPENKDDFNHISKVCDRFFPHHSISCRIC